jgi:hypothetical protein
MGAELCSLNEIFAKFSYFLHLLIRNLPMAR